MIISRQIVLTAVSLRMLLPVTACGKLVEIGIHLIHIVTFTNIDFIPYIRSCTSGRCHPERVVDTGRSTKLISCLPVTVCLSKSTRICHYISGSPFFSLGSALIFGNQMQSAVVNLHVLGMTRGQNMTGVIVISSPNVSIKRIALEFLAEGKNPFIIRFILYRASPYDLLCKLLQHYGCLGTGKLLLGSQIAIGISYDLATVQGIHSSLCPSGNGFSLCQSIFSREIAQPTHFLVQERFSIVEDQRCLFLGQRGIAACGNTICQRGYLVGIVKTHQVGHVSHKVCLSDQLFGFKGGFSRTGYHLFVEHILNVILVICVVCYVSQLV